MSILENIELNDVNPSLINGEIVWRHNKTGNSRKVPNLFSDVGEPYIEINLYANNYARNNPHRNGSKTLQVKMTHLKAYTDFIEKNALDWRDFPRNKYESVLFKFRQFLIHQRNEKIISPSTANARMNAIINFYRKAQHAGWIEKNLWKDRSLKITFVNKIGLQRVMNATTTDLAIPYRKQDKNNVVEDGLTPLSIEEKRLLLGEASKGNLHLFMMLQMSFVSGARSETIRTLTKSGLMNAQLSPDGYYRVQVGPGTGIATKFDKTGMLQIPQKFYEILRNYAFCDARALRSLKAVDNYKDILFLTKTGRPYSKNSLNQLMCDLRDCLILAGYNQFKNFHFHQARATAITERMIVTLDAYGADKISQAIEDVRIFAMHNDEKTTWKYYKYVEELPVRSAAGNEFIKQIFGLDIMNNMLSGDAA